MLDQRQRPQHLIFSAVPLVPFRSHKMERVHQLVAAGNIAAEGDWFWIHHWHNIASAKVPLTAKVATYNVLKIRDVANVNTIHIEYFYKMVFADQAFVAALDLNACMLHRYRGCVILIDDDVEALAGYDQELSENNPFAGSSYFLRYEIWYVLTTINSPRCMRFLLQDTEFRERVMMESMTPLVQRLVEELVQPTDWLNKDMLLLHGRSMKLIGMCVKDEELVADWLYTRQAYAYVCPVTSMSVLFGRKLYDLAKPDQIAKIKREVVATIFAGESSDGCFELAWLFGLLGSFDPKIQECFRQNNVSWFPAFTFAMIVAMCDGYLKLPRTPKRFFMRRSVISEPQRRFFALVARLPMDLQALISLRLWGHTSTVISSEKFNRALLAII
jgi:hypothetical protein